MQGSCTRSAAIATTCEIFVAVLPPMTVSYLCRLIDMLHMGYVDEVLFGREAIDRLPAIASEWVTALRTRD